MKMKSFPILETENLILRAMMRSDQEDLFAMRSDPRMHAYTDTAPDQTLTQTEAYIEKMRVGVEEDRWIIWAMETKLEKKVIGSVGIWNIDLQRNTAELSYGIAPAFQGKGLMKEALKPVLDYGFCTMSLSALEAYTEQDNIPSRRLLEALGFIEAERVDDVGEDGKRIYHMIGYRLEQNGCPSESASYTQR